MTKKRRLAAYAATAQSSARPGPGGGGGPGFSARPYQPAPGAPVIATPQGAMPPGGPVVQGYPDFRGYPGAPAGPQGAGSGQAVSPMVRMVYPEIYDNRGEYVNSPHMYLPNPNAEAPIDRGAPLSTNDKAIRLGLQSQPRTLGFMARGDAAYGSTIFRRTQIFAQLAPVLGNTSDVPLSNAIGLATQRTSDSRPRIWHVSVFGIGQILSAQVARGPLAADQIINDGGFWGNAGIGLAGSAAPYVPQVTTFKARAMIHDESGQRFFDFDVIGTRSFDVSAYAVTIFVLLPQNGLELQQLNPNAPQSSGTPAVFSGLLQDAIVGARVVPGAFEPLPRIIQQTQNISLTGGNNTTARMPIPPGAKTVQLYSQGRTPADLLYTIDFEQSSPIDTDPPAAVNFQGPIVIDPVTFRSEVIDVPNASTIRFLATLGADPNSFIAVFTVDP